MEGNVEGSAEGKVDGLEDGDADGLKDGRSDGTKDGWNDGLKVGVKEGSEDGMVDGEAVSLTHATYSPPAFIFFSIQTFSHLPFTYACTLNSCISCPAARSIETQLTSVLFPKIIPNQKLSLKSGFPLHWPMPSNALTADQSGPILPESIKIPNGSILGSEQFDDE